MSVCVEDYRSRYSMRMTGYSFVNGKSLIKNDVYKVYKNTSLGYFVTREVLIVIEYGPFPDCVHGRVPRSVYLSIDITSPIHDSTHASCKIKYIYI